MKTKIIKLLLVCAVTLMTVFCLVFSANAVKYLGDINGDGKVTAADARLVLRMAVGLDEKIIIEDDDSKEEENVGTAGNTPSSPIAADGNTTIICQRFSSKPSRNIKLELTKLYTGEAANDLAYSENMYNDEPTATTEWRFYVFDLTYVSSSGGANDVLEATDVINEEAFFTSTGATVQIADTATLGDKFRGSGVYDVELYPGASAQVVIGVLVPINSGDLLLRVPNKSNDSNTWVKLTCDDVISETEQEPEEVVAEDDPVNIAANLWILAQGQVKNPSTFEVHNIYVKGDFVYLWYSAQNSYGADVNGYAVGYYENSTETEGYEFYYNIDAGDGLIRAHVDVTAPSTWDSTVDYNAVVAQKAAVGTIHYTYTSYSY